MFCVVNTNRRGGKQWPDRATNAFPGRILKACCLFLTRAGALVTPRSIVSLFVVKWLAGEKKGRSWELANSLIASAQW
jgi:hypothetical protein